MSGLDLTVGWPLALWGLLALPLLALFGLRSRFPIGARRRRMVTIARALSIIALVVAMADLRVGWPTTDLAVSTVIDTSLSVAEPERRRTTGDLETLATAHDEVAWLGVGDDGRRSTATDVAVAVATLPRDRARRMIVATDGRDDGLGAAIAAANRAGVNVSLFPVGNNPPIDLASISRVRVPRMVAAGDAVDVGVELFTSRGATVSLTLTMDGEAQTTRQVVTTPGRSSFQLPASFPDEEGVHELAVIARADGDVVVENDTWRSLVRVSPKPRVRILHDPENGPPALAQVLDEAGLEVEVTPVTGAPTASDELRETHLVVVDEANPNDMTETQQRVLREWVEREGGGLISVTGTHPIRRAPRVFREIEPIQIPPAIPEPRPLELVIVVDRSSSMSGIKILQARNAAVAAIRALRADARVGVVAFSGGADRVMAPVGMDQRDDAISFVQRIRASGGTNIAAALGAANAIMSRDPRYIHHVILLSDGVSSAAPALAAARAIAGRASISAITLGPRNNLMAQIAQIGRGRYHVTSSAGSLPSLFLREAQFRQPPAHRRGSFRARRVGHLAMLEGVDIESAPPLGGFAMSSLRRGATQVLATPDRRPLLAHWHRGLGQVATWTSATSGSWADAWRLSPVYREMWVAMARGMLRTRPVEPPQLSLRPHPMVEGVQILTVLGPTLDGDAVPIIRRFEEPSQPEALELFERGPGVWQTELIEGNGFLIDARMPQDEHPTSAIAFDRPYDPELATFGVDAGALERLAAAGGGQVLRELDDILDGVEPVPVRRSLRTPLLAIALLSYLLGLLWLRLPDHSVSATVVRPERRRRRWGSRRRSMHPDEPTNTREAA